MTKQEGRGVEVLLRLAEGTARGLPREEVRSFVDGLDDNELADLLCAASAASLAAGGTGNLLYESAAARLRGIDVASVGSAPTLTIPDVRGEN